MVPFRNQRTRKDIPVRVYQVKILGRINSVTGEFIGNKLCGLSPLFSNLQAVNDYVELTQVQDPYFIVLDEWEVSPDPRPFNLEILDQYPMDPRLRIPNRKIKFGRLPTDPDAPMYTCNQCLHLVTLCCVCTKCNQKVCENCAITDHCPYCDDGIPIDITIQPVPKEVTDGKQ